MQRFAIRAQSPVVVRIASLVLAAGLLASCGQPEAITPTAPPTAELPSGARAAQSFVDALNQQAYPAGFALLDETAQTRLKSADGLRRQYDAARTTATAITVTWQLRGGLLQDGSLATAQLVGVWQTAVVGSFNTTSTLRLAHDGKAWRVAWTADLILPGLANGELSLRRDVPPRGSILAADGSALAAPGTVQTVGVRRSLIASPAEEQGMARALSRLTGLTAAEIIARYQKYPEDWFAPISDVSDDALARLGADLANYPAVSARPRPSRAYPQGTLAPHVVGYVGGISPEQAPAYRLRGYGGDEQIGIAGLEAALDETLAGRPGGALSLVAGGSASVIARRAFVPGRDVYLSISPTIQLAAQSALTGLRGAVVVMDPRTGAVLAMASSPAFDSATFVTAGVERERSALFTNPARPLLNRAIQSAYPPGSTFKMVTLSAAVGEGLTNANDAFFDPGYWDGLGSGYRKTCWLKTGHGRISLQDGLTASCDIVFYELGKRLDAKGQALLGQYASKFGFGARTGVELPGEVTGNAPDPAWKKQRVGEVWTPGDTVNLSIGQGFMLATPIQVTQMTAAIANGGNVLQPRLVAGTADAGAAPKASAPVKAGTLPAPQALSLIQKGMIGVTTNPGIGTATYRYADFDYYLLDGKWTAGKALTAAQRQTAQRLTVAGKTGTSETGTADKPYSWFTAYAPAADPQLAITVLIENIGEGSTFAAPRARQIIEASFGLPISDLPKDTKATE
jgi:penicillin-binding protein 2